MSIKILEEECDDEEKILFEFLQNLIPINGKQRLN